ncbi:hypothetical protein ASALC70_01058 [Alcanivorax sp. ALC70]|nr:hypothetical protein ASALC70_01058 [Alcanivorax sp. ALC70]
MSNGASNPASQAATDRAGANGVEQLWARLRANPWCLCWWPAPR